MTEASMSPERAREILETRARALARRPADVVHTGTIDVVEFRIAGERYAIESRQVFAVLALTDLVPLPGATTPVAGVMIWRGKLLTILDVRAALGLSTTALNDLKTVIVVGDSDASAGILVDVLEGISKRPLADFRAVSEEGRNRNHKRGLASDAVMLIDGAAIAREHAPGRVLE
jgi:purine-binding chemotaxis protein CheW